jgi:hypothetical protein
VMSMYSACPLPFDVPDPDGENKEGTSPAVGVGGWAPTPPDDHDGNAGGQDQARVTVVTVEWGPMSPVARRAVVRWLTSPSSVSAGEGDGLSSAGPDSA